MNKIKKYKVFNKSLQHLIEHAEIIDDGYMDYQFKVFESLVHELTNEEGLVFNTLFARISYLGLKYKPKKNLLFDFHIYRKEYAGKIGTLDKETLFYLGLYVIKELLNLAGALDSSIDLKSAKKPDFKIVRKRLKGRKLHGRFALIGKREEKYILIDENNPSEELFMKADNLDVFRNSVEYLDSKVKLGELPITIGLVYIDIESDNVLLPQVVVIQPDYLVDVTAIAECFKPTGGDSRYFLINKFLKKPKNKYITIGNIVNFFLDELMSNTNLEFKEVLQSIFHLDPIIFAKMNDAEVKDLVLNLRNHFVNLKRVVNEDLQTLKIERKKCFIEPSFYSPIFGIQGRLDIYYQKENSSEAAIIELKSGKLFMANSYGLNTNHYTQTLLYELMIRSVFDFKIKPINYILYSVLDSNNIRFAPTITAQQKEAISIRNDIIATEERILKSKNDFTFYEKMNLEEFPGVSGFLKRDIENIQESFHKMDNIDKVYFSHFASFIAREHQLAKNGNHTRENSRGQSNLWLMNDKEKEEHFSILRNMEIYSNQSSEIFSTIDLKYSLDTNALANFRKGDIVLMYPSGSRENDRIKSQIFKGTVLRIGYKNITIRLRSKIYNQTLFAKFRYWNIEHDFLDSGFAKMYRSLNGFFVNDKDKISLILSKRPPRQSSRSNVVNFTDDLTETQKQMITNIVNVEEYYLLWGPPGTGKTSKIISQSVKNLIDLGEDIMLLAYTNRAVDELSEAVESIDDNMKDKYIRIGSRFSSDPKFLNNIFDNKLKTVSTRDKLKSMFETIPIFISTVSSLLSKEELFTIKKFDTLIVDEASQLLEPMLISILPYFKRFILVGDHMQLSAVVAQSEIFSQIENDDLKEIGMVDMRYSLFERLLTRAIGKNWDWAYGMLDEQGRMHKDIMKVANLFYGNKLKIINTISRLSSINKLSYISDFQKILAKNRLVFFPSDIDGELALSKANIHEAKLIVKVVHEIYELYKLNNKEMNDKSIGIVTTFRAQIAIIKNEFEKEKMDISKISIDTVERYQGSARDIIIYSTSVNSLIRFKQIIAENNDGLDRKLNVVLTRAKEQFILIGNEDILSSNNMYKKIIEKSYYKKLFV